MVGLKWMVLLVSFLFDGYSPFKGTETNPYNTKEPHGKHVRVNNHGYDVSPDDPGLYY